MAASALIDDGAFPNSPSPARSVPGTLDAILEGISDAFYAVDGQWRLTYVNGHAEQLWGRRRDELIGRPLWDVFPEAVGTKAWHELNRAFRERRTVRFETVSPVVKRWIDVSAYPAGDGISVHFREITERKQAEAALHESEERFRAVFDRTAIGLAQTDLDARLVLVNDRFCEITGYAREELLQRTMLEISHADDVDRNREQFRQLVSGEVPTYQIEKRYIRPDGVAVWVHVTVSLLRDAHGRPQYVLGAVQDITRQREAQEALRENEERYRFIVENTSDAVWRFDLIEPMPLTLSEDEQIEWGYRNVVLAQCNDGMARIYGYERAEQMIGLPLAQILPGSDLINIDFLRRFIRSGYRLVEDEAVTRAHDDSERIVLCNFVGLVRDEHLFSAFGTSRDVTTRRRAEQALRESEERLRELNRTLEQRVAERTQELRQNEEQLRAFALELTRAEQRERRRLSLVLHDHLQQLLVGAQMHIGIAARQANEPEQLPLSKGLEVIAEALRTCRSLAVELSPPLLHDQGLGPALAWLSRRMRENYRLPVEFSSDGSADPQSEELRELLFQAARELLLNVIKHAGAGSARLRLTRDTAHRICLEVQDDGIGFDPQARDVEVRSRQSFGLFHIRERLRAVGGEMALDSARDRGTRVGLIVPETRVSSPGELRPLGAPHAASAVRLPASEPAADAIRILLVDDHAMVRKGLIAVLERQPDFRVVGEAVDGQQAVEVARDLDPDVVIMDVNLPGINGVAATHHITMTMPHIRVIGLSAHDEAMEPAMVEAGAVRYLTKGGPSDELVETIRAVASSRAN